MAPRLHNSPLFAATSGGNTSTARQGRVGIRSGQGKRHSFAEKLAARTIPQPNGCWEVQGHALHSGHVQLSEGSVAAGDYRRVRAHVFAWEQAHGKVPAGMVIMHACDNPRCVRLEHLRLGTQRDNIHDSIHKGRYNTFGIQKLNAAQVREIRALAAKGFTQRSIAAKFGIARNTVSGIVHRKSWDHLDRPFAGNADASVPVPAAQAACDRVFERVPTIALPILGEVA